MKFVGGDDTEFGVAILPPELMADDGYVHSALRLGNCFGDKDDARGSEKERHHDENWDDGPGELDLIAAVNLGGFPIGVGRPVPETDQRVEQQASDDEKDDQSD